MRRPRWNPGVLAVLGIAGLLLILRVPSLVEPSWYADEGTYADVGISLDHGGVLYHDVWDNKPPGMYWMGAVIDLISPSGHAFHAVAMLVVALTAIAIAMLGRCLAGPRAAVLAALVFVVLASLPDLDGDLLNAEPVGAALVAAAMLVLVHRHRTPLRVLAAGALIACAVLFKAVFAVDLVVATGVAAWTSAAAGARPGRDDARQGLLVVAGAVATWAVAAVLLAASGSLQGLVHVLAHSDVDYLGNANGVGAGSTTLLIGLVTARLLVVLVVGLLLTLRAARGRDRTMALLWWWLTWDVLATVISARGFTHYAQQMEPVLALLVAVVAGRLLDRRPSPRSRVGALALLVLSWPVVEAALLLPRLQVAAVTHQAVLPLERHNVDLAQLPRYYSASWRRITGTISDAEYDRIFPTDPRRIATVAALFATTPDGARVFVWGSIHWVYATSGRLPAGRYVTLNSAYYSEPGSQQLLLDDLRRHPPAILVVDATLPRELTASLRQTGYRLVPGAAAGEDCWLAPSQLRGR